MCRSYGQCGGGVAEETLVEMQMLSDDQIITGATEYLEMKRVQNTGYEWHGIGFDLSSLNKTFNDGNQIAMWVKKDKGENVKVEFQFADGSSVTTSLQWVSPEDGWKYMVFDLNNPPAPVPTKDIAKPSIFKVEGHRADY